MPKKSILVVHEDIHVAGLLCKMIQDENFIYHLASSIAEVEALISDKDLHLILTDMNIQGISRNEYIDYLRVQKEAVNVIIVSSMDQGSIQKQSKKLGAKEFINLPVTISDLQDTIKPYL